jgi:hypothetical protein
MTAWVIRTRETMIAVMIVVEVVVMIVIMAIDRTVTPHRGNDVLSTPLL